jgi:GIY-YIG catalytic domain-containing protein/NUMOD3 motif-containing protein
VNSYYFYKRFTKNNISVNLLNKNKLSNHLFYLGLRNYYSYNKSVISLTRETTKLITIRNNLKQLNPLIIENLKSKPVKIYYNALLERYNIIKAYRGIGGIYLFYNLVNGKQYVGSSTNLGLRLARYYYPSVLLDKRYISNSILKYGHNNFSIIILEVLDKTDNISKEQILDREQYFIELYKPKLNILSKAYSSLGFKHLQKTKDLIADFRTGKPISEKTKRILSNKFSGENNPFYPEGER